MSKKRAEDSKGPTYARWAFFAGISAGFFVDRFAVLLQKYEPWSTDFYLPVTKGR